MKYTYSDEMDPPGLSLSLRVGRQPRSISHSVTAKVDTGADKTALPEGVVRQLNITKMGSCCVRGAFDTEWKKVPTFYVALQLDDTDIFVVDVISRPGSIGLLGRDVLNQLVLVANGPERLFELNPVGSGT
jgi:predicted aspartyl protease